ncbi:MAG: sugar phosphate isomerase/epimerase [Bacteroidetes bacterium]|nr:sugar phosphate isomerase/epimerase [Bacteroidota bacterium]
MKPMYRRKFLEQSTLLLSGAFIGMSFSEKKKKPLLSFSTLGCPGWTFQQIVDFASANQYEGIEMRGILKQLDLPTCEEFKNAANIKSTLQLMADKQLKFVDLGSSCTLHFADKKERQKNLDDGKRFLDLAAAIHCPNVRVYPNNFIKGQEKAKTMELIADGLLELGAYAKDTGVNVLMETHGDLVYIADLKQIMESAKHQRVGLVWDPANMYLETNESPEIAYRELHPYIRHAHIKDAKKIDGKISFHFLGEGNLPIYTAIDALYHGGYKGYYSFEWEKLWHPEIAEPELALADYPKKMMAHFK